MRRPSRSWTAPLQNPAADLAAKIASRGSWRSMTRLSLPGDPLVQDAIEWGKQNIADLTQSATDLQIRWTNQGKQFPAPSGTVPKATWIGAGYPDYPWIFGTDAEYTAFAVGRGRPVRGDQGTPAHAARRLGHPQRPVGRGHPRGRCPTAPSGSGTTPGTRIPDGTIAYDFNTDETVKFPSTVALLWRWTGDNSLP